MREANFTVSSMHSDLEQKDRDEVMKQFRAGERCMLIAYSLKSTTLCLPQNSIVY